MNQEPEPVRDDDRESTVRFVCGFLAALMAALSLFMLCGGLSNFLNNGIEILFGALSFGSLAFRYRRSTDTHYDVSRPLLLGTLAACILPPLVLLFVFSDRPGWLPHLVLFFLLSISIGPFLLLRRYARPPGKSDDQATAPGADRQRIE